MFLHCALYHRTSTPILLHPALSQSPHATNRLDVQSIPITGPVSRFCQPRWLKKIHQHRDCSGGGKIAWECPRFEDLTEAHFTLR
jgi:hypothetical protein